jgi:predicted deacetylase
LRELPGEKVLHGFTHSRGRDLWNTLWYGTANHSEFGKLDRTEASTRLESAVAGFKAAFGTAPRWFCAPRWHQSPGTTMALRSMGIDGYMRIDDLVWSGRRLRIPAVLFDVGPRRWQRSLARRRERRRWPRYLEQGTPFRLTLHPGDIDDVRSRREIERLIGRLHSEGWDPLHLREIGLS